MGLSIRAYAQHRGVSHTAVSKAIKTGRITPGADGKIDPIKADAEWERNTLPAQSLNKRASATRTTTSSAPALAPAEPRSGAPDYQTSRAVREAYAARLAKLEFEERSSKLVSKDEIEVRYFQLARQLRDRILQVPRKVAPEIVAAVIAKPDQRAVEELVHAALRDALEELSR